MRSEYSWLPPHREPTITRPHQVGVSFSTHSGQEYESAGRAVRADIPAGAVFVTGEDGISWGGVNGTTEALEIYPDPALVRRIARRRATSRTRSASATLWCSGWPRWSSGRMSSEEASADIEASTLAHRLVAHVIRTYGEGGGRPVGRRPGYWTGGPSTGSPSSSTPT